MLGVLAIVGVLSVGGIAGYSKAMNKFKTNKLIEQVNMISTNVRTLYASQKNYSDLTNGVAIRTGILPNEF
jgi:type II secretory pathway pseudopilin PulG